MLLCLCSLHLFPFTSSSVSIASTSRPNFDVKRNRDSTQDDSSQELETFSKKVSVNEERISRVLVVNKDTGAVLAMNLASGCQEHS